MRAKPILCLDLDGCIHRYSRGWQDGTLYDGMVDGFVEWALKAMKHFQLVVYSSRSKEPTGIIQMQNWFRDQLQPLGWQMTDRHADYMRLLHAWRAEVLMLYFAHEKPSAFLTIDDRAIQFRGDWNAWWLAVDKLKDFKPWTVAKPECDPPEPA